MKAIIQRVTKATVTVGGEEISSIGRGLCVLLGISVEDTQKDADYLVRKILNLRLFEDENGRAWSKSVMDRDFEVLCVSQFTLQCILKANKPDFHSAMPAELAQPFYNSILENMRSTYKPELIKDGKFGAYMQVHIQNDGPVTIELMSPSGPTDPKQFAYQPRLGLDDAVIYLLQRAHLHLDGGGDTVRITVLDFSSAFNTIQPLLLDEKLRVMGVGAPIVSWITDYLTGRPQFVLLDRVLSDVVLSKQEKQQQRKEKTRSKGPSESSREKLASRSRQDPNASSGADGDVSSERET